MPQLFSNNVDVGLAADIAAADTTATLTDGSGLSSPASPDYELLTIENNGVYEIVKMTARTTNDVTIERAQEGTTAQDWSAGARVYGSITAASMADLQPYGAGEDAVRIGESATAAGNWTVSIGLSAEASAQGGVALGEWARATGDWTTGLGPEAEATANNAVAVGGACKVGALDAVGIGKFASVWHEAAICIGEGTASFAMGCVAIGQGVSADENAVAVGRWSYAPDVRTTVVGFSARARGVDGVALGSHSDVATGSDRAISLGYGTARLAGSMRQTAFPAVPAAAETYDVGPNDATSMISEQGASPWVFCSDVVDLTDDTVVVEPVIPANAIFFVDEVGVIATNMSGVTTAPSVQFGKSTTNDAHVSSSPANNLAVTNDRERFTNLSTFEGILGTLHASVVSAGAGTVMEGRFYWRGWIKYDESLT